MMMREMTAIDIEVAERATLCEKSYTNVRLKDINIWLTQSFDKTRFVTQL